MGRGSYLGGSTVIRPGMGWFSGETSQTRATSVRPKKKARQKSKPAATAPQLKNRPAKKYDFSGYLMSVVSAELRAQVIPLPKKPEPRATVLAYGDALTWARLMPEYEALKQKLAAKLSDQKKNSIGGHPPAAHSGKPESTPLSGVSGIGTRKTEAPREWQRLKVAVNAEMSKLSIPQLRDALEYVRGLRQSESNIR